MIVRTRAPAKINWTLEVLGKRDDGYHEIKSVMQTIDLCDEVEVETSDRTTLSAEGYEPDEDDLALRAVGALEEATGRELPVSISLVKRIPLTAGLGGGSSDAAAVLRAVDRLYGLGFPRERLAETGAKIGSDVPFFCYGGTALVEGRGERVTPLPDAPIVWLVVVAPQIKIVEKTKGMYGRLTEHDFTGGFSAGELIKWLSRGDYVRSKYLYNTFGRGAAYEAYPGLGEYEVALASAGAKVVQLAGSGPALFSLCGSREDAEALVDDLTSTDAELFVARTLRGEEATAVVAE